MHHLAIFPYQLQRCPPCPTHTALIYSAEAHDVFYQMAFPSCYFLLHSLFFSTDTHLTLVFRSLLMQTNKQDPPQTNKQNHQLLFFFWQKMTNMVPIILMKTFRNLQVWPCILIARSLLPFSCTCAVTVTKMGPCTWRAGPQAHWQRHQVSTKATMNGHSQHELFQTPIHSQPQLTIPSLTQHGIRVRRTRKG